MSSSEPLVTLSLVSVRVHARHCTGLPVPHLFRLRLLLACVLTMAAGRCLRRLQSDCLAGWLSVGVCLLGVGVCRCSEWQGDCCSTLLLLLLTAAAL